MEKCVFCGKDINQVDGLLKSTARNNIYICNHCVNLYRSLFGSSGHVVDAIVPVWQSRGLERGMDFADREEFVVGAKRRKIKQGKCVFCRQNRNEVGGLIKSMKRKDLYICDSCVSTAYDMFAGNGTLAEATGPDRAGKEGMMEIVKVLGHVSFDMTPHQIQQELNRFIVGQERAKKALSVAMYNHIKRLNDGSGLIKKSNILLAGPSGTGKTLFASAIAKIMNVPFVILDATALVPVSFRGNDVEVCLQRLLEQSDGDVQLAQKGIVYIDDIDKLAGNLGAADGSCPQIDVQAELLKMIEGCEVTIPLQGKEGSSVSAVKLNTKNILFICSGAFSRLTNNAIVPESLIEYGLIQELVGRLPVIVALDALEEDDLIRILTEPEDSIIKEYQLLFEKDGVKLVFKKNALHEIARAAFANGTGARGLRSILEDVLLQIMYDLPEQNVDECIITEDTIHTKVPILKRKNRIGQFFQSSCKNSE